jgi:hypothetical protein
MEHNTNSGISELESRIGHQNSRISSVREFFNLKGEEVWLVTSPMEIENKTQIAYGNSFLNSWVVDDIYYEDGSKLSFSDIDNIHHDFIRENGTLILPTPLYTPHATKHKIKNDVEYRYLISLIDYNIIPNKHTNHAVFTDKTSAVAYQIWLKMMYSSDMLLDSVNDKVINGILVDWNNFLTKGLI